MDAHAAGVSMAEKLRLWKAQKAAQQQQQQPAAAAAAATKPAKSAALKSQPHSSAAAAGAAASKSASAAPSKSAGSKRGFAAVSVPVASKSSAVGAKKAKLASMMAQVSSMAAQASAQASASAAMEADEPEPLQDATVEEEEEDQNEDLGLSLSSIEATPPSTAQRHLTPVSQQLRARMTAGDSAIKAPSSALTPRAQQLREFMRLPSSCSRPAASPSAATPSLTPLAEKLRAQSRRTPPSRNPAAAAAGLTPVATSLAEHLRMERTPPNQAGSMASLQASARATSASAQAVMLRSALRNTPAASLSAESTPASSSSSPTTAVDLLNASSSSATPVARNLAEEMEAGLDNSMTIDLALAGVAADGLDASLQSLHGHDDADVDAEDDATMLDGEVSLFAADDTLSAPVSPALASAGLFDESEYIPGLSTPAECVRSVAATKASAAKSHRRLLTPSRAHQSSSHVLEGALVSPAQGSSIVLASVRAHARDAARLGSATFLSPVRRSTRTASKDPALEDTDRSSLESLLAANGYAYNPNPALASSGALTTIGNVRASANKASKKGLASIEEHSVLKPAARANSTGTPMPVRSLSALAASQSASASKASAASSASVGSSFVVLQPVRARRGSNSVSSSCSPANPNPLSAEYLLSPVRRSARHSAPQSVAELTRLLMSSTYAYAPNPLLSDSATVPLGLQMPPAAPTSPALDDIEEEEQDDEEDVDAADAALSTPLAARIAARTATPIVLASASAFPASASSFSASSSSASSSRIATPLPTTKSKSKQASSRTRTPMHAAKVDPASMAEEAVMMWEQSKPSSSSSSSSSSASLSWEPSSASSSKSPLPTVHELDAQGFAIPHKVSRGHKRKGSSADMSSLELKLQAVNMIAASGVSASAIPPRMATPRPQNKKQKRYEAPSAPMTALPEEEEESLSALPMRRSFRVATPIR